jgi:hypothetical protein
MRTDVKTCKEDKKAKWGAGRKYEVVVLHVRAGVKLEA